MADDQPTMIDLHAHILPGIDDGPTTLEDALAMLRAMEEQGVTTVVATAHAFDGRFKCTKEAILRGTEALQEGLVQAGLQIQVLPSMEIFLGFDLMQALKAGQVLGLNQSKYLVVELPHREYPAYTDRALFELMMAGYRPIINHPERNHAIRRNPELMEALADKGIPAMVTAASLLGRFGPEAQRTGEGFLREGLADLIVSDAHDLVGRAPLLRDGLEAARELGKLDQESERSLLG